MANLLNRVAVSTLTTGTGTVTLGSVVSAGFFTMAEAGAVNGATYKYLIEDGTNVEFGIGTYTSSGTTLSRDTVVASRISGTAGTSKINLSGSATVRITALADDFVIGLHSMWIPAGAMTPRVTNGASFNDVEMTTNKNMVRTLNFDTATQEFAQFSVRMPKSWNRGTVTFAPVWSHPSTSTNFGVVFGLAGVAVSNDDALDVAFGTAQTSTDTGGTTNDSYEGPVSSAITIAGSPASGDLVMFEINRTVANGSDTMAVDARLHGIVLFFSIETATDV